MSISHIQSPLHLKHWLDVNEELAPLGKLSHLVFSYLFNREEYFGQTRESTAIQDLEEWTFAKASLMVPTEVLGNWTPEFDTYSYANDGQQEYYLRSSSDQTIPASRLFKMHLLISDANPYMMLDIGAGDGQFSITCTEISNKLERPISAHNLSASDLQRQEFPVSNYHIHDAMDILNYPPIASKKWDFMIARLSFPYFPDNARTLAQYYELLAPDGLLIVTHFRLFGLGGQIEELVHFLNTAGYAIIASVNQKEDESGEINTLIIQKTHEHLNFPFSYDPEPNTEVCYRPDPELTSSMKRPNTSKFHRMCERDDDVSRKLIAPTSHPLTKLVQSVVEK